MISIIDVYMLNNIHFFVTARIEGGNMKIRNTHFAVLLGKLMLQLETFMSTLLLHVYTNVYYAMG